jgi:hypothetical protein
MKYKEECDRLRRYLDEFERLHVLLIGKLELFIVIYFFLRVTEENKKYVKVEHSIFQNLIRDNQTLYDSLIS